jgi:hypothetical protein
MEDGIVVENGRICKTSATDLCGLSVGRVGNSHTACTMRQYERWSDNGRSWWDWDHEIWWEVTNLVSWQHDIPFGVIAKDLKAARGAINDPFRFTAIRIDSDGNSELFHFLREQFMGPQTIQGGRMMTDIEVIGRGVAEAASKDSIRRRDLVDRLILALQRGNVRVSPEFGDTWRASLKILNTEASWRETDASSWAAALALCYYDCDHVTMGYQPGWIC